MVERKSGGGWERGRIEGRERAVGDGHQSRAKVGERAFKALFPPCIRTGEESLFFLLGREGFQSPLSSILWSRGGTPISKGNRCFNPFFIFLSEVICHYRFHLFF